MFGLNASFAKLFTFRKYNNQWIEDLEETLLLGDVGVHATQVLIEKLQKYREKEKITTPHELRNRLILLIEELLQRIEYKDNPLFILSKQKKPIVFLVVGVNGSGKTTTIGKLCYYFKQQGFTVLLGAGDSFRAAAVEQLQIWGDRNQATVVTQEKCNAASITHNTITSGIAKNIDIIIIDTAGRLSTQSNLMEELKKVKKVINKNNINEINNTILVLDGNIGQNSLIQVKEFHQAVHIDSLIITKLDGTAKGGILCAIANEFSDVFSPKVMAIGVGEKIDDLVPFSAKQFTKLLISKEKE